MRVDPSLNGALMRYQRTPTDESASVIRDELRRLLRDFDASPEVTGRILRIFIDEAHRTYYSDREAGHFEAVRLGQQVAGVARQLDAVAVAVGVGSRVAGDPAEGDAAATIGGPSAAALEHLLEQLRTVDPAAAARITQAPLAALASVDGISIDATVDGLYYECAAIRLDRAGMTSEATELYLRASQSPSCSDPVRQIVRASVMASLTGDEERAEALFAEASSRDSSHPSVVIGNAQRAGDPEAMVEILEAAHPWTDRDAAVIAVLRGQAALSRRDYVGAREQLAIAMEADASFHPVRDFAGLIVLLENKDRFVEGIAVDVEVVGAAGDTFLELRGNMRSSGRLADAGRLTSRAVECRILCDDFPTALGLLEEDIVVDEARSSPEIGALLANAARQFDRFNLMEQFLEGDDDPELEVLRCVLRMERASSDPDGYPRLVAMLDDEQVPEDVRSRAAFLLLSTAAGNPDVPWSDRAQELLASEMDNGTEVLEARSFKARGEIDAAWALARSVEPPTADALALLAELASARGDWGSCVQMREQLFNMAATPRNRLRLAEALVELANTHRAEVHFTRVWPDPRMTDDIRRRAFAGVSKLLHARGDYPELSRIADEWLSDMPGDPDATWLKILCLGRLGDHVAGRALLDETRLPIENEWHASIAMNTLAFGEDVVPALLRMASISDQFGREDEDIEAMFLLHALRKTQGLEIPDELRDRMQKGAREFFERFPESQVFWRQDLGDDPAATIRELVMRRHEERLAAEGDVLDKIAAGDLSVAHLAAVLGAEVVELWEKLWRLPAAFGEPRVEETERAAAHRAVGAVWDPASLALWSKLPEDVQAAVRAYLVNSVFTVSCRDEPELQLRELQDGTGPKEMLGVDPETGEVVRIEISVEEIDRRIEQMRSMRELIQSGRVVSDNGNEPGNQADVALTANPEAPRALVTLLGSISAAKREGAPLYSDDRFIRRLARSDGVEAFGTVALIDVLREKDRINDAQREAARLALARARVLGLALTPDEVETLGAEANWASAPFLAAALADPGQWRWNLPATLERTGRFIQCAWEHDPDSLEPWLTSVLEAALADVDELTPRGLVENVILITWDPLHSPPRTPREFFAAVTSILRGWLARQGDNRPDPRITSLGRTLAVVQANFPDAAPAVLENALSHVPAADAEMIRAAIAAGDDEP